MAPQHRYRKEEIVDGTLLQIILDEVRSAKKAGINMQQTDHYLVGVIDRNLPLQKPQEEVCCDCRYFTW